jgi:hypothetical protein
MSSHREAPQISQDPVADSTDVYAFRSPDKPSTVTLIANYVPLQAPEGGPNFYSFGDDVTYDINIDNTGTGTPNITYRFTFNTVTTNPSVFLYNTGPILSLDDATWSRKQFYTLTKYTYVDGTSAPRSTTVLGTDLPCPPCNIGPLSTPNYPSLAHAAIKTLDDGTVVFAGQRAEGFYVDLGSIFDLGVLRPFQADHTTFGLKDTGLGQMAAAINATSKVNVHSLALQVPITDLTAGGTAPKAYNSSNAVIGVWTAASRPAMRTYGGPSVNSGDYETAGGLVQVSRLGNPLVNEALIGIGDKDAWNASTPAEDKNFVTPYFSTPVLATLLPDLYPGVFPNLAKYNAGKSNTRPDIEAILLTGIPAGIVPGFQNELTSGGVMADMLRLNVFYPPAKKPNAFGLLGGDVAGFPNGRRVWDDVTTIEIRALAGATLPLVDKSYKADKAAGEVSQGLTNTAGTDITALGTERYMTSFPYLGRPYGGAYIGETPLVDA